MLWGNDHQTSSTGHQADGGIRKNVGEQPGAQGNRPLVDENRQAGGRYTGTKSRGEGDRCRAVYHPFGHQNPIVAGCTVLDAADDRHGSHDEQQTCRHESPGKLPGAGFRTAQAGFYLPAERLGTFLQAQEAADPGSGRETDQRPEGLPYLSQGSGHICPEVEHEKTDDLDEGVSEISGKAAVNDETYERASQDQKRVYDSTLHLSNQFLSPRVGNAPWIH